MRLLAGSSSVGEREEAEAVEEAVESEEKETSGSVARGDDRLLLLLVGAFFFGGGISGQVHYYSRRNFNPESIAIVVVLGHVPTISLVSVLSSIRYPCIVWVFIQIYEGGVGIDKRNPIESSKGRGSRRGSKYIIRLRSSPEHTISGGRVKRKY